MSWLASLRWWRRYMRSHHVTRGRIRHGPSDLPYSPDSFFISNLSAKLAFRIHLSEHVSVGFPVLSSWKGLTDAYHHGLQGYLAGSRDTAPERASELAETAKAAYTKAKRDTHARLVGQVLRP